MCFRLKQSSLFCFYALPSGGKSNGAVVHYDDTIEATRVCTKSIFLVGIQTKGLTMAGQTEPLYLFNQLPKWCYNHTTLNNFL